MRVSEIEIERERARAGEREGERVEKKENDEEWTKDRRA